MRPEAEPVALRSASGHLELTVDLILRPQRIGPARVSSEVLASANGSSWSATPAPRATPPTTPAYGALPAHLPTGWVAVASPTGSEPEAFTSRTGSVWKQTATLVPAAGGAGSTGSGEDGNHAGGTATPHSGAESGNHVPATVNGVCAARLPTTAVLPARYVVAAVGSDAVTVAPSDADTAALPVTTRSAAAWSSPSGATWKSAAVNGIPPSGSTETMSGCLQAGAGLFAYGSAPSPSGVSEPAMWRSTDGTNWARVGVSAFAPAAAGPLVSAAQSDGFWLAAGNPDPQADPFQAGVAGWPGPAATAGTDAGVGPRASVEDGRDGLWLSSDGGSIWQLIDTATAPWLGDDLARIDLVGFAPTGGTLSSAVHATSPAGSTTTSSSTSLPRTSPTTPTPVVVGTVNGQLAGLDRDLGRHAVIRSLGARTGR